MIPRSQIIEWSRTAPWPSDEQVEQDLVLSRLIVDIANHERLGEELVFRGGTCLHKLHIGTPRRYSEDLDYVRRSPTGIGPVFDDLRTVAAELDLVVNTDIAEVPKLFMRGTFESGTPFRIKIEMNTHERSPARPHQKRQYEIDSTWFTGRAAVLTFDSHELVATKIRALYQRSKGRDLFDLWLALNELGLDGSEIAACFEPYRPEGYSRSLAQNNLNAKLQDQGFRNDLAPLVSTWPEGYDLDNAADQVVSEVLAHV